jgi:hypothetical protein
MSFKQWYQSKGVIGGLGAVAGMALQIAQSPDLQLIAEGSQGVQTAIQALTLASAMLALYGRATATTQIGKPPEGMLKGLLAVVMLGMLSPGLFAANCEPGGISCPAYAVCASWTQPTTRENAVPLPLSELSSVEISLGAKVIGNVAADKTQLIYPIPTDTVFPAGTVMSSVAIDTVGNRSKPFSCTFPAAFSGPKYPPSAPTNVKVTAG